MGGPVEDCDAAATPCDLVTQHVDGGGVAVGDERRTILAAKGGDREQIIYETADLWFHCLVMLAHAGLHPDDVLNELARREGLSGIDEKAGRTA